MDQDEIRQPIDENVPAEETEAIPVSTMTPDEIAAAETFMPKFENSARKTVLTYLHDLVYLLAVVLILFLLCFRVVVVSGESMENTLKDGDYLLLLGNILVDKYEYGDIIVAAREGTLNGNPIVKRVIATEGQTVDIDFDIGVVYVDGVPLQEPYTKTLTELPNGVIFPLVVEEGHIFVLGDNRNNSKDSRDPEIGQIDIREVLGKAIFLMLPGTSHGNLPRDMGRIGVVQ